MRAGQGSPDLRNTRKSGSMWWLSTLRTDHQARHGPGQAGSPKKAAKPNGQGCPQMSPKKRTKRPPAVSRRPEAFRWPERLTIVAARSEAL